MTSQMHQVHQEDVGGQESQDVASSSEALTDVAAPAAANDAPENREGERQESSDKVSA